MFNAKKKARRLIVFGLSLMMLMSTGIVAHATTFGNGFYFILEAKGGKKQTSSVQKTNDNSYASIDFTICQNTSNQPLWYRVRAAADDAQATGVYGLYGTGIQYPQYINGQGEVGKRYYLRLQTDSTSEEGATAAGSWNP